MGWLRSVGSLKLYVSFAKEPYKRDYILQERPIILRSLQIVATPYFLNPFVCACICVCMCVCIHTYIYVCIHICIHTYIYIYLHIHLCIHIRICMKSKVVMYVHTNQHRNCLRALSHDISSTYVYMYSYIYVYTHTYI